MPYYANLPRYQEPTPEEKSDRLVQTVAGAVGGYQKHKAQEAAQATLANPNATPIQQAMALAALGQEKLGTELYNKSADQSIVGGVVDRIDKRLEELRRRRGNKPGATPGINPNADIAPTTAQPGAEGTPTQRPFTVNGPQNASRNATELNANQGNIPNPNPSMIGGQAPQQQEVDPLEVADIYDDAALELAKTNPSLARTYENKANQIREDVRIENNAKNKISSDIAKEDRANIKEFSKPFEDVQKLQKYVSDLEEAEKIVDKPNFNLDENWTRNLMVGILEGKEKTQLIADFLKTADQQRFFQLVYPALKAKELGGSNPSTREVLLSMQKLPSMYKGKSANKFLVKNILQDAKVDLAKGQTISELQKIKGLSYGDFKDKVNETVNPYQKRLIDELQRPAQIESAKMDIRGRTPKPGYIFMMDPQGNPREVPVSMANSLQDQGGIILK